MPAVKAQDFEKCLKSGKGLARALLIHGQDSGLVSEYAKRAAQQFADTHDPPGEVLRLDDGDLQDDPDRPVVELRTLPMFGGPKVVWVRAGPRLKAELVDALLEDPEMHGYLIVEAGALRKDAKLRKQFEAAKHAQAVVCYSDGIGDLSALIDDVLGTHNLGIGRDEKEYLRTHLGADRTLSRGELEKLALYCGGQDRVTIDDIDAIVGDAADQALDRVVLATFSSRPRIALNEYDRTLAAGQQAQSVLLAIQRHVFRLHSIRSQIEEGKPVDAAVRAARPPVHFSQVGDVSGQVQSWPLGALETALHDVQRTIASCRTLSRLEDTLVPALITRIAARQMPGRKAG